MRRCGALFALVAVTTLLGAVPVEAAGAAPVGRNDRYTTKPGKTLNISAPHGVLANDSDLEKDKLTAKLASTSLGTLTFRPDGSFVYTPKTSGGTDSFSYWAYDGTTFSNFVSVTIKVDSSPVAKPDSYGVVYPGPRSVAAPGVLANDSDVDGDILRVEVVKKPSHGNFVLKPDGSFVYTPLKRVRDDFFLYRAIDATNKTAPTRVDLKIVTANAPPVAVDDIYVIPENVALEIGPPGVLANDTDANGDPLTAELLLGPSSESFQFLPDGSFFLQMPENWDTDVSFTYRVTDGVSFSAPAIATIDIIAVNNPPEGQDDYYEMYASQGVLEVSAPGVLANDFDPVENDNVHVDSRVGGPGHGDLVLNRDGSFTYTPDAGFVGTDGFSYLPADSTPAIFPTFVTIEVLPDSS